MSAGAQIPLADVAIPPDAELDGLPDEAFQDFFRRVRRLQHAAEDAQDRRNRRLREAAAAGQADTALDVKLGPADVGEELAKRVPPRLLREERTYLRWLDAARDAGELPQGATKAPLRWWVDRAQREPERRGRAR